LLRFSLVVLALFMSCTVNANDNNKFTIKGAGAVSCQQYISAVVENQARLVSFVGWLEGYLSFYNESTVNTVDIAPWQSSEYLSKALFAHCKKKPELPFFTAVKYMIAALKEQRLESASEMVAVAKSGKQTYYYREIIKRAQIALNTLLGEDINTDGTFGPATEQALKQFQKQQNIEQTGLPDQPTLQRLFRKPSTD